MRTLYPGAVLAPVVLEVSNVERDSNPDQNPREDPVKAPNTWEIILILSTIILVVCGLIVAAPAY